MNCQHSRVCPFKNVSLGVTKRETPGLWDRLFSAGGFEHSVDSVVPWTDRRQATPTAHVSLQPGEKRKAETFRQRSLIDIAIPLSWAVIGGLLLGGIAIFVTIWQKWGWWFPPFICLISTAAFWFISSLDIFKDGSLLMRLEEMTRKDINQDGQIGGKTQNYQVEGQFTDGARTIYVRFGVENATAFHRFCKAVAAKEVNFSGRGAGAFDLSNEWDGILDEFKDRGLAEWDGKQRTMPRLTRWGEQAIATFAATPP